MCSQTEIDPTVISVYCEKTIEETGQQPACLCLYCELNTKVPEAEPG